MTQLRIDKTIDFKDYRDPLDMQIDANDVTVFLVHNTQKLSESTWEKLLSILPLHLVTEVTKYKRWQDRQNCLFGKLLVYIGYHHLCKKKLDMNIIKRDKNNKPYLSDKSIHFNISHSNQMVVCAFSKQNKIGIDVEQIKDLDYRNFTSIFNNEEVIKIREGDIHVFYEFWTKKEAVLKNIGTGFMLSPKEANTVNNKTNYNHVCYDISTFSFLDYCFSIAHNGSNKIRWIKFNFSNFANPF